MNRRFGGDLLREASVARTFVIFVDFSQRRHVFDMWATSRIQGEYAIECGRYRIARLAFEVQRLSRRNLIVQECTCPNHNIWICEFFQRKIKNISTVDC